MPAERYTRIVNDRFLHRRRDHCAGLAGLAQCGRHIECGEYITGVSRVESARNGVCAEWHMNVAQGTGLGGDGRAIGIAGYKT